MGGFFVGVRKQHQGVARTSLELLNREFLGKDVMLPSQN